MHISGSKFFWIIVARKTIWIFFAALFAQVLYDSIEISVARGKYADGGTILNYLQILRYSFPEYVSKSLPISYAFGIFFAVKEAFSIGLMLFAELRGKSAGSHLVTPMLFLLPLCLGSFAFSELKGRDLKKFADEILEDDLLRVRNLDSKIAENFTRVLKLNANTYLSFSKIELDPADGLHPRMLDIFIFSKDQDHFTAIATKSALIEKGKLIIPTVAQAANHTSKYPAILQPFTVDITLTNLRKMPTVTISALTTRELLEVIRDLGHFDLSTKFLIYLSYNLAIFLVLPLLIIATSFLQVFSRSRFN